MLQANAVPLFFCAAFWALTHPYAGIVHDARIYIGRVMADLDPAGLGRDLMFVHDGQFAFSLFPLIIRGLVVHFGPGAAAKIVSGLGCLCSFVAALVLAAQLVKGRAVWLLVIVACVLPHAYGSQIFQTAETLAVPRPFAEAAVLLSLAALISGRPLIAIALVLIGFALHPIMALAGAGVLALAYWHNWRVIAAALAAGACALFFALLGVPLFDRLLVKIDSEWLDFLLHLNSYLSPGLWTSYDWGAIAAQTAIIAIAADLLAGPARRVFFAALAVGLGGLVAAIVLGDMAGSLLAVQMQFWRAIWLIAALAPFAYGLCVIRLGADATHGWSGRVTLAALSFGLFANPDLIVALAAAALALITHFGRVTKTIPARYLAALATAIVVVMLICYAHALIDFERFLEKSPEGVGFAVYCALHFSVAALPVCAIAAAWFWAKPRLPAARPLALVCGAAAAAAAVLLWNALPYTSNDLALGRDKNAFTSILDDRPGEVLWVGGTAESWYLLGRPQWASALQPVSSVFSRPLAMLWRERAQILLDYGFAPRNIFEPRMLIDVSAVLNVTAEALASFCARDDAPVAVIFPVERNESVPEGVHASIWTPPHPRFVTDNNEKMVWHEIDRYAGVSCSKAPRAGG
ncbi:MAG: hypothetical protein JOZ16_06595 [Methylobacteriaceae bacterium]|nr:hypothetical protein [Methylobacteriaceae bacterium]